MISAARKMATNVPGKKNTAINMASDSIGDNSNVQLTKKSRGV